MDNIIQLVLQQTRKLVTVLLTFYSFETSVISSITEAYCSISGV